LLRKSRFMDETKLNDSLDFRANSRGQNCPQGCPHHAEHGLAALGEPLTIREVADLIGCSVWTIRQRYLRAGIPFVRLRPHGKLLFYKHQVNNWLLTEQQKGGTIT
jgi:excisionase family DNA binding protein